MEDKYKAHVIVFPFPAQGHITPAIQFSKRLISKGIKVTLATTIYISKLMHPNPSSQIDIGTISDGFDNGGYAEAETPEIYKETFESVGSKTLSNLIEKINGSGDSVKALIYDGSFPWALDVAKKFGVLGVLFFSQSCAVNSVYYHVQRGILSVPITDSTVSLPGLPLLRKMEAPSFISCYGTYPVFFDTVVNQFADIDQVDWLIFNTFYQLEKEVADWWMAQKWRVSIIGPTVPSMYMDKRLEDDKGYGVNLFKANKSSSIITSWLDKNPTGSTVYISFGSVADLTSEKIREIAMGLQRIDLYFLWVVRGTEISKLPNNFVEETSEKGLVVEWCNQLEVLAHESIGCFVTHCGFNSVLEALSFGVPIVAMAQWTDQITNAKYVEDVWGIGIRVLEDDTGIVRKEELEICIRKVMESKEIKKNASKWKKLAKEAVDFGGSSDKNIDEFVAFLSSA